MIDLTSYIRRWKQWSTLPFVGALLLTMACSHPIDSIEPATTSPPIGSEQLAPHPQLTGPSFALPAGTYVWVEQMPELAGGGGNRAIVENIQQHLVYPSVAAAHRKEGQVDVLFVVTDHGQVQFVRILKGLGADYDSAVVTAVQKLPKFAPGKQDKKPVAVSLIVPVRFALSDTAKIK